MRTGQAVSSSPESAPLKRLRVIILPAAQAPMDAVKGLKEKTIRFFEEETGSLLALSRKRRTTAESLKESLELPQDGSHCNLYSYHPNDTVRVLYTTNSHNEKIETVIILSVTEEHDYDAAKRAIPIDELIALIPQLKTEAETICVNHEDAMRQAQPSEKQVACSWRGKVCLLKGAQAELVKCNCGVCLSKAGTGKTLSGLAWVGDRLLQGFRVIYLSPSEALSGEFKREVEKNAEAETVARFESHTFDHFLRTVIAGIAKTLGLTPGEVLDIDSKKLIELSDFAAWYRSLGKKSQRDTQKFSIGRIFEEIGNVICQPPRAGEFPNQAYLSEEDYLGLGQLESYFPREDRRAVYLIFLEYLKYIKDHVALYDPNLCAFQLISVYRKMQSEGKVYQPYEATFIDEGQRASVWFILLSLHLLTQQGHWLLAGDVQQALLARPQTIHLVRAFLTRFLPEQSQFTLITLSEGLRSAPLITAVAGQLSVCMTTWYGANENGATTEPYAVDFSTLAGKITFVGSETLEQSALTEQNRFVFIIIPDEMSAEAAYAALKIPSNHPLIGIYHYTQVAGLEADSVIIFNFPDLMNNTELGRILFNAYQQNPPSVSTSPNKIKRKDTFNHEPEIQRLLRMLYTMVSRGIKDVTFVGSSDSKAFQFLKALYKDCLKQFGTVTASASEESNAHAKEESAEPASNTEPPTLTPQEIMGMLDNLQRVKTEDALKHAKNILCSKNLLWPSNIHAFFAALFEQAETKVTKSQKLKKTKDTKGNQANENDSELKWLIVELGVTLATVIFNDGKEAAEKFVAQIRLDEKITPAVILKWIASLKGEEEYVDSTPPGVVPTEAESITATQADAGAKEENNTPTTAVEEEDKKAEAPKPSVKSDTTAVGEKNKKAKTPNPTVKSKTPKKTTNSSVPVVQKAEKTEEHSWVYQVMSKLVLDTIKDDNPLTQKETKRIDAINYIKEKINHKELTVDEKKLLSIKAFLTCVINEKETWAKQLLEMVLAFEKNLTLEEAVQWYQEKINQAPSDKHFFEEPMHIKIVPYCELLQEKLIEFLDSKNDWRKVVTPRNMSCWFDVSKKLPRVKEALCRLFKKRRPPEDGLSLFEKLFLLLPDSIKELASFPDKEDSQDIIELFVASVVLNSSPSSIYEVRRDNLSRKIKNNELLSTSPAILCLQEIIALTERVPALLVSIQETLDSLKKPLWPKRMAIYFPNIMLSLLILAERNNGFFIYLINAIARSNAEHSRNSTESVYCNSWFRIILENAPPMASLFYKMLSHKLPEHKETISRIVEQIQSEINNRPTSRETGFLSIMIKNSVRSLLLLMKLAEAHFSGLLQDIVFFLSNNSLEIKEIFDRGLFEIIVIFVELARTNTKLLQAIVDAVLSSPLEKVVDCYYSRPSIILSLINLVFSNRGISEKEKNRFKEKLLERISSDCCIFQILCAHYPEILSGLLKDAPSNRPIMLLIMEMILGVYAKGSNGLLVIATPILSKLTKANIIVPLLRLATHSEEFRKVLIEKLPQTNEEGWSALLGFFLNFPDEAPLLLPFVKKYEGPLSKTLTLPFEKVGEMGRKWLPLELFIGSEQVCVPALMGLVVQDKVSRSRLLLELSTIREGNLPDCDHLMIHYEPQTLKLMGHFFGAPVADQLLMIKILEHPETFRQLIRKWLFGAETFIEDFLALLLRILDRQYEDRKLLSFLTRRITIKKRVVLSYLGLIAASRLSLLPELLPRFLKEPDVGSLLFSTSRARFCSDASNEVVVDQFLQRSQGKFRRFERPFFLRASIFLENKLSSSGKNDDTGSDLCEDDATKNQRNFA